jgi:hypothetical protein
VEQPTGAGGYFRERFSLGPKEAAITLHFSHFTQQRDMLFPYYFSSSCSFKFTKTKIYMYPNAILNSFSFPFDFLFLSSIHLPNQSTYTRFSQNENYKFQFCCSADRQITEKLLSTTTFYFLH